MRRSTRIKSKVEISHENSSSELQNEQNVGKGKTSANLLSEEEEDDTYTSDSVENESAMSSRIDLKLVNSQRKNDANINKEYDNPNSVRNSSNSLSRNKTPKIRKSRTKPKSKEFVETDDSNHSSSDEEVEINQAGKLKNKLLVTPIITKKNNVNKQKNVSTIKKLPSIKTDLTADKNILSYDEKLKGNLNRDPLTHQVHSEIKKVKPSLSVVGNLKFQNTDELKTKTTVSETCNKKGKSLATPRAKKYNIRAKIKSPMFVETEESSEEEVLKHESENLKRTSPITSVKMKPTEVNFIDSDSSLENEKLCENEYLKTSPLTLIPLVSTDIKQKENITEELEIPIYEKDIVTNLIPLELIRSSLTENRETNEILKVEDISKKEDFNESVRFLNGKEKKTKVAQKSKVNLLKNVIQKTKNGVSAELITLMSDFSEKPQKDSINLILEKPEQISCELSENKATEGLQNHVHLEPIKITECSNIKELSLESDLNASSKKIHVFLNPIKYIQLNASNSKSDLMKDVNDFKTNMFLKNFLRNNTESDLPPEKLDICGLDTLMLDNVPDGKTKCLTSSIQSSIDTSDTIDFSLTNKGILKSKVDEIMKKSVLTDDLEKKDSAPKMFESKYSKLFKRRKIADETAGKGWFNLPKTELTEENKRDLQLIKMRNVLDSKHHYKRNDSNKLPKYFQIGTVVEGSHEYYNSRIPNKKRKATMVDELLDDAEFRRKNKKNFIQLQKKKMSGGKKFYKQKKNQSKPTWART